MQHGWAMCSMWPYWRRQQVDYAAAKGAVGQLRSRDNHDLDDLYDDDDDDDDDDGAMTSSRPCMHLCDLRIGQGTMRLASPRGLMRLQFGTAPLYQ